MNRLIIKTQDEIQRTVEDLNRDLERRILAGPPGQCPVDIKMCIRDSNTCLCFYIRTGRCGQIAGIFTNFCYLMQCIRFGRLCAGCEVFGGSIFAACFCG